MDLTTIGIVAVVVAAVVLDAWRFAVRDTDARPPANTFTCWLEPVPTANPNPTSRRRGRPSGASLERALERAMRKLVAIAVLEVAMAAAAILAFVGANAAAGAVGVDVAVGRVWVGVATVIGIGLGAACGLGAVKRFGVLALPGFRWPARGGQVELDQTRLERHERGAL